MLKLLFSEAKPSTTADFLDNMHAPPHTPLRHSRASTPSEDWVFVDGAHTQERSPQLKHDNMPSGQVANATADGIPSSFALFEADIADIIDNNNNDSTVAHKPPSNISTETPGTDDSTRTVTDLHRAGPAAAPTRCTPGPAHTELTLSNMARYQRELEQFRTGSLAGWAADAGMGSRRLVGRSPSSHHPSSVGYCSVLTAGGQSMASGVSSIGAGAGDWAYVQPSKPGDEEVAAAGAWCFDTTIPLAGRRG
ncbi:uncharacterized protein B0H64DRAFT_12066 [Chaetomium fimeti]|uniref:Uncharacterized protein n=1 Tax=Chaetomium fimeti TaxID=1854472 RepID=A0AAE0HPL8_9PEZI|nr:hypothetical protein B0H64DRAFT_12066 [Chaetomium fimeti]